MAGTQVNWLTEGEKKEFIGSFTYKTVLRLLNLKLQIMSSDHYILFFFGLASFLAMMIPNNFKWMVYQFSNIRGKRLFLAKIPGVAFTNLVDELINCSQEMDCFDWLVLVICSWLELGIEAAEG